ncbi:energy transducer TonB [Dyella jiangningensis]
MKQGMRAFVAACIVSASCHVYAADTVGQAEASMLVTGTMTIRADGSVDSYALDHAEKLPPEVGEVVQRSLPTWKFTLAKPGEAPLKESMSLRIVARAIDKDRATVRIAGASFGKNAGAPEEDLQPLNRTNPVYPRKAIDQRVSAAVYLMVKVDRDGKVADAIAEQVNLLTYADPSERERLRKLFASSALATARGWTWQVPSRGEHANDPYWLVRVPIKYKIFQGIRPGSMDPPYGQWEAYLPGERQKAPWASTDAAMPGAADAVADDRVQPLIDEVRLLTPLDEG